MASHATPRAFIDTMLDSSKSKPFSRLNHVQHSNIGIPHAVNLPTRLSPVYELGSERNTNTTPSFKYEDDRDEYHCATLSRQSSYHPTESEYRGSEEIAIGLNSAQYPDSEDLVTIVPEFRFGLQYNTSMDSPENTNDISRWSEYTDSRHGSTTAIDHRKDSTMSALSFPRSFTRSDSLDNLGTYPRRKSKPTSSIDEHNHAKREQRIVSVAGQAI